MFVLAKSPDYWWPVIVNMPSDDGQIITSQFDARFKRFSESDYDALLATVVNPEPGQSKATDVDVARQLLVGWRGVNDPAGHPIEFGDETLGQLLDLPDLAFYVVKAYQVSRLRAQQKN